MQVDECSSLLGTSRKNEYHGKGLSTFFAIICIMDVFGVFPVVSLPKAIIDCGYHGIFVIIVVCSVQIYTAALLGRCWVIAEEIFPMIHGRNREPYIALAEITLGKRVSSFLTFLLDLTVFGGGIPNLIVASQNLQLLGLRISDGRTDISYCYWILITGTVLCPILWLGSPKDMKCICSTSTGIVVSVFILTCGCLIFSDGTAFIPSRPENLDTFPWQMILKAYGIIAFQFDIHPSILTIQVDMNDKTNLTQAILGGFSASLFMFGITGVIASSKYGVTTQASILETLPTTIPLHLAATLIAIQLCLTSAVSNNVLYQQMEDCMRISREFNSKRCILRTTLTILAILIAESVPAFDLVMSLIGGVFVAPFAFILPPIMFLKMRSFREKHFEELAMSSITTTVLSIGVESTHQENIYRSMREDLGSPVVEWPKKYFFLDYLEVYICIFIAVSSIILTLATSYINITNAVNSYSDMSNPCIYNISLSLLYS